MNQNPLIEHLSAAFIAAPFNQMLGLKLAHIDKEHVAMSFNMRTELVGNYLQGILHGGVISSVLDMAGGLIVMASAIYKHPDATMEELAVIVGKSSTIDLQVSFLNPGRGDSFIAKGYLVKSGNQISFTRMELLNQNEVLIATGNGTYRTK